MLSQRQMMRMLRTYYKSVKPTQNLGHYPSKVRNFDRLNF